MLLSTGGRIAFGPLPKLLHVVAWVEWLSKFGTQSTSLNHFPLKIRWLESHERQMRLLCSFSMLHRAVVGTLLGDIYVRIELGRKEGLILHATEWTPIGTCELCYDKHLYKTGFEIRHWNMRRFMLVSAVAS